MDTGNLEIRESVEELKDLIRKETQGRQKLRLQSLYLIKTKQSQSRIGIATLLGMGKKAVGNWLKRYEAEGLESMLTLRTHTNRAYSLSPDQEAQLIAKLSEPAGFSSYGAIQSWLKETFGLDLPYPTVHKIVRYRLDAKLKVPRKSHVNKKNGAIETFREELECTLLKIVSQPGPMNPPPSRPIRLFTEDEARFGLITVQRRRITLRGVKPIGVFQQKFKSFHI